MCWYGIWGRSCNSCWGWSNPRAALSKPEMQSPRIQDSWSAVSPLCSTLTEEPDLPSSHCCCSSWGLECCLTIWNKNLHLWELISLFRVCSWTVNRLWSPNLSSDGSVGLFPWGHSGASGTPLLCRSSAELGMQCRSEKEDLFFFFLSTLENKIEELTGCKTCSLLPNCFLKCLQLYKSCTYCH